MVRAAIAATAIAVGLAGCQSAGLSETYEQCVNRLSTAELGRALLNATGAVDRTAAGDEVIASIEQRCETLPTEVELEEFAPQ